MENILITFESKNEGLDTTAAALEKLGQADKANYDQFVKTNALLNERNKSLADKSAITSYVAQLKVVGQANIGAFGTNIIKEYEQETTSALDAVIKKIEDLEKQQRLLQNTSGRSLNAEDQKLYQQALQATTAELKTLYAELDQIQSKENVFDSLANSETKANEQAKLLSVSIEDLRAKIGVRQDLLIKETDVTKIAQYKQEIEALEGEIEQINNIGKKGFDEFGRKITDTDGKAVSFRTQLRNMQQELSALEESGSDFSETFQMTFDELAAAAGAIADQMGDTAERVRALASDTANLDAAVEAVNGLAGGYQFLAGVTALVGDENQDLQQTLVKLNAIMAITQGLQQAQAFLRGQSILMIKGETAAQALLNFIKTGSIKATQQSTAATVENIAVNEAETVALEGTAVAATGASVAMQVFRTALLLTGIGAILVLLVAFVTKMAEYVATTDDATAAQLRFNDALEKTGTYLDAEVSGIEDANRRILASMKARNASDADMAKQEIASLLFIQDARKRALDELNKKLQDSEAINKISAEKYKELTDKQLELENQLTEGETTILERRSELQVKYYQDSLKSLQAYAQARATLADEKPDNLQEQLAANIALAKADATVQLANANLTAGERYRIEVELQKKIDDVRLQYQVAQLNKEKNFIDATAALTKEGSAEEFNARMAQLTIEKEIAIANAKSSTSLIAKINSEFYQSQTKMIKQYNYDVVQNSLNTQIQTITDQVTRLQIANVSELSDEMIAAKKDLLDKQAALEVASINFSEHNEELRAAKIKAVYDKELLEKQELEKAKLRAELENQSNNATTYYEQQNNALNSLTQNFVQFGSARKRLDDEIYKNSAEYIVMQRQLLEDSFAGGLISQEEYNKQYEELDKQHYDAMAAHAEAAYQRKVAAAEYAASIISQLEQTFFQGQFDRIEAEKQANQDLVDNKLITQDEFNKRQKNLQKQESALKKEQALFEIFIEGAKRIFEIKAAAALQTAMLNPVGAAIALSQIPLVLIQQGVAAALVATQKFRTGKVNIDGPGTETSDSIPAMLSKGETVITAKQTRKHTDVLTAIHEDHFEQWLQHYVTRNVVFESDTAEHKERKTSAVDDYSEALRNYNIVIEAIRVLRSGGNYETKNSNYLAINSNFLSHNGNYLHESEIIRTADVIESRISRSLSLEDINTQLEALSIDIKTPTVPALRMPEYDYVLPELQLAPVSDIMMQRAINNTAGSIEIDYDKLGASVAKHVGKLDEIRHVDITIDEDGWRKKERQKRQETEFVNNYYSSKGTGK